MSCVGLFSHTSVYIVCICNDIYICNYMYVYIYVYIYICIHIHICVYTHTHTYSIHFFRFVATVRLANIQWSIISSLNFPYIYACSISGLLPNDVVYWYSGWLRNPNHQLKTVVNIPWFIGFQPSGWWCRISQPSTVCLLMFTDVPCTIS